MAAGFEGFLGELALKGVSERRSTCKKRMPVKIPTRNRQLATRFGRRNGNLISNLLCPNSPGMFSAGFAKKPPKDGPKIEPILHTSGMIEKALGWSSFSGTISATIVRMIPTIS